MPKSRKKFEVPNMVLVLLSIIISILLIEAVLSRTSITDDAMKGKLVIDGAVAGHCYSSNPNNYFEIDINNFPEYRTVPDTDELRFCIEYDGAKRREGFFPQRASNYALVGDSFVFGEGVNEEDTLTYYLSSRYNSNFLNWGFPGHDIYLVYQETKKIDDVEGIIYFYNINDVLVEPEIGRKQKFINDLQNIRLNKVPEPMTKLVSGSELLRLIRKTIILRRETRLTVENYFESYSEESNFRGVNQTISLMVKVNEELKDRNIDFQMVILPLLYKDNLGRYPFEEIHKFLLESCEENNISCVDAYPVFDEFYSLKKFMVHPAVDYHPNGEANKLIVDYLADNNLLIIEQ
ncbi:hypothetical protein ACFLZ6_02260 [Nanoarchaeota archaeon]